MNSSNIVFDDQGFEQFLPVAGMTIEAVKHSLRDSLNIPYFSDAVVNGTVLGVEYVLRSGDHLQFRKRFGMKGADDRSYEEREAEGLINAYDDLARIAAEVKRRKLPKDQSIDLMGVRVRKWAVEHFGKSDARAGRTLAEVVKQLKAFNARLRLIEARQRAAAREPRLTESASGSSGRGSESVPAKSESTKLTPRWQVIEAEGVVVHRGVRYALDQVDLAILDCLVAANGGWVSTDEMRSRKKILEHEERIDRLIGKLKRENRWLSKAIDGRPGRGFKIILE